MLLAGVYLTAIAAFAGSDTATATQTISGTFSAVGKVSVTGSVSLTSAGGPTFPSYTGSVTVSYRIRTSASGTGNITAQVTSAFSPAGGPSVASGDLTYTCSGATLGTNCVGTQTASTSSATGVVTIGSSSCTGGGGSCSSTDPNTASASFTLTNKTTYKTGNYSAVVTYVISAT